MDDRARYKSVRETHPDSRVARSSGKRPLDLVTLVAPCGTGLDVEARGQDAREAVAALVGLIASRSLGADEA
jgi:phosphotransferase system HPr-like phosphotransfer protein